MNVEILKRLLEESSADAWEIADTQTEGWEFYYIRHALDQNRAKKVRHIKVCVYKKFDDFLGNAAGEIAPTATEAEAKAAIDRLIMQAGFIKNPAYRLNQPKETPALTFKEQGTEQTAKNFLEAMQSLPENASADINSYEIFTAREKLHFVTSEGIDLSEEFPSSTIEVVVNARDKEHEIELYRMYSSGTCDSEGLKDALVKTMQYGTDRLKAGPTPVLEPMAVVFSTADAANIYDYFLSNLSSAFIVRKMSDWKIGEPVVKDAEGDRITLRACRILPNSSMNYAFDEEGAPTRDLILIEDGVARSYWGSRMYSQYLGLEENGIVYNWEVSGGTKSTEEIRSGSFLEVVEFSDFQCDSTTGDIFGEIRLGYLHDGEDVRIVTGGSISGTMQKFAKTMRMSTEQVQYNNVRIPAVTRLEGVTITGAVSE